MSVECVGVIEFWGGVFEKLISGAGAYSIEMAVLENYVKLVSGIPKRLHLKDNTFTTRRIRDPVSGFIKNVSVLEFVVDYEDGVPVEKIFSVIQSKLAAALAPYLDGKRYRDYLFTITKIGEGFTAEFRVEAIPWTVG